MFQKVGDAEFVRGEHEVLRFWAEHRIFDRLREQNRGKQPWSFLDGPITANNPMGVHHAWGRTYKDAFQRYWAMNGRDLRYQNGFDCQGLWVEVEVEKQLGLGAKSAIEEFGVDRFVWECKKRVLKYASIQTEQSIRLGYWMEWDDPQQLRKLADAIGTDQTVTFTAPKGETVTAPAEQIVERLGNPDWGGSYFTFSTENNETIWTFLKKCHERGKVYRGHDVMPWSGKAGSAYSQMEVADGRKLTTHRALFVRFPILSRESRVESREPEKSIDFKSPTNEYLLIWTTTPWTLTSNVAAMVNPDLEYVQLKSKRDGAVYYFAKENLEFQRLAKEFKEGFGRPEWSWPKDAPKLKTLAQIFKEQGGYEIVGTVKGADMLGWKYRGPFDDLAAQNLGLSGPLAPVRGGEGQGEGAERFTDTHSLLPSPPEKGERGPEHLSQGKTGVACHRVIDGGRDFKGNPNVVAGEGTGIVHSAPGCGDIDYQIGKQAGLVSIAPLGEDGRFLDGFGQFTGKVATAPETVDAIIDDLKQKELLVAVEKYPHIYPFCWRTGDELVFRLVDEWFINMDWRDEIMDVTRRIKWLPDSIQGQERELEWLTNMRDWMVSKKRYWGLALPIWINPDDPSDFEVIGSLNELKERAVEGWDEFAGHTPHKPWIDRVKIKSAKTGALLTRIPDVGNPWLDAGIVPFSTMGFRTHPDLWRQWYPADLVTECFPGQFRNWFYSMLAMSTMMRHGESDAEQKKPFKTLLGHRLVMNEQGEPMSKSKGTAIWFEEAAEQLGVDTMRWMYLAQNPAQDLRFGTRQPDQRVTLQTVNGPAETTIDGVPTCLVQSGPADEVRRLVLLPLWNSYAFFVNYARLDEFDPRTEQVPFRERPQIDQWILTNLEDTVSKVRNGFEAFDTPAVTKALAHFIDDLSNWYIRRNRKRFWRSRSDQPRPSGRGSDESTKNASLTVGAGGWDVDKLAAYQTLYRCLVTTSKLLAPAVPFLAERMYQNLVGAWDATAPASVHLCEYPQADPAWQSASLLEPMEVAQQVVRMGHRLREVIDQRVRQPLAEVRVASASPAVKNAVGGLAELIADELNVKRVQFIENLSDIVTYKFRANPASLGKKHGKLLGKLKDHIAALPTAALAPLRNGQPVTIELGGTSLELTPDDISVSVENAEGWASAADGSIEIALATLVTPELMREGMSRDFVRQVQQLRKDAALEIEQRIRIDYWTDNADVVAAVREWSDYIRTETLADALLHVEGIPDSARTVGVGDARVRLQISTSDQPRP